MAKSASKGAQEHAEREAKSKATGNEAKTSKGKKGTDCPITRAEFREHAEPLTLVIDGNKQFATVKEYDSGTLGWWFGEKITIEINGEPVRVQCSINLMVVGSKQLPTG